MPAVPGETEVPEEEEQPVKAENRPQENAAENRENTGNGEERRRERFRNRDQKAVLGQPVKRENPNRPGNASAKPEQKEAPRKAPEQKAQEETAPGKTAPALNAPAVRIPEHKAPATEQKPASTKSAWADALEKAMQAIGQDK